MQAAFDKTVLIIDDDAILVELFDEILSTSFSTRTATNIVDAIAILQNMHISAVISDYHLGTHDADVLINWIAQKKPELISKIILLTGEADVTCNHQDEISSILFKPVDFNTLKLTVHSLFAQPQELKP